MQCGLEQASHELLDRIEEAIVVIGAELPWISAEVCAANKASRALLGMEGSELVGEPVRSLIASMAAEATLERIGRELAEGVPAAGSLPTRTGAAGARELHWSMGALSLSGSTEPVRVAVLRTPEGERGRPAGPEEPVARDRLPRRLAAAALEPERARQGLLELALDLTSAQGAVLEVATGGELVYEAAAGAAADQVGLRLPVARSISGHCLTTGRSLVCTDASTDERVALKHAARSVGFRSAALVPMGIGEEQAPSGVLKVYADTPGRFGEAERVLLERAVAVLGEPLPPKADSPRHAPLD